MPEHKRNMGASVRARLLNLAQERGQTFDLLLTRYALERLLYRLSTTKYRESFVLKGAMLMTTWFDQPFRPTRDLDFERPVGLTETFARDPAKQQLWKSFSQAIGAELPPLDEVIEELADFLMPQALAAAAA